MLVFGHITPPWCGFFSCINIPRCFIPSVSLWQWREPRPFKHLLCWGNLPFPCLIGEDWCCWRRCWDLLSLRPHVMSTGFERTLCECLFINLPRGLYALSCWGLDDGGCWFFFMTDYRNTSQKSKLEFNGVWDYVSHLRLGKKNSERSHPLLHLLECLQNKAILFFLDFYYSLFLLTANNSFF